MHVNLLPAAFRRRLIIRRCLSFWTPVWLACLACILVYLGRGYWALRTAQQSLAKSESQSAPIRLVSQEAAQIDLQLKTVLAQRAELRALAPPSRAVPVLIVISNAVQSVEGRLQLRRLTLHHSLEVSPPATPASQPDARRREEKGQITLEAVAADDAAISAFVTALRKEKVLRQVELKSSTEWHSAGQDCRKFDIVCHFGKG